MMFWVWTHNSHADNNQSFDGASFFVHQARYINKEIGKSEPGGGRKSRTLSGPVGCGEALFNANDK
jgi:hypothetical protein